MACLAATLGRTRTHGYGQDDMQTRTSGIACRRSTTANHHRCLSHAATAMRAYPYFFWSAKLPLLCMCLLTTTVAVAGRSIRNGHQSPHAARRVRASMMWIVLTAQLQAMEDAVPFKWPQHCNALQPHAHAWLIKMSALRSSRRCQRARRATPPAQPRQPACGVKEGRLH